MHQQIFYFHLSHLFIFFSGIKVVEINIESSEKQKQRIFLNFKS